MPEFDIQAQPTELSQTVVIIGREGDDDSVSEQIEFESDGEHLLVASIMGNEENVDPKNVNFRLFDPNKEAVYELQAKDQEFQWEDLTYIDQHPMSGVWCVQVSSGGTDGFSVAVGFISGSKIKQYKPGGCDVCKISVYALAALIFVSSAKAVIPAKLITTVALFYDVVPELASDIIKNLMVFPVKKIAEKLCEKAYFCP